MADVLDVFDVTRAPLTSDMLQEFLPHISAEQLQAVLHDLEPVYRQLPNSALIFCTAPLFPTPAADLTVAHKRLAAVYLAQVQCKDTRRWGVDPMGLVESVHHILAVSCRRAPSSFLHNCTDLCLYPDPIPGP